MNRAVITLLPRDANNNRVRYDENGPVNYSLRTYGCMSIEPAKS